MTFAWYGHLRNLSHRPWLVAALVSWAIALFEYLIQVPANRIGHEVMNVGQLKILQIVVTLAVFVPFSIWYLKEPARLDYLWAGLCLLYGPGRFILEALRDDNPYELGTLTISQIMGLVMLAGGAVLLAVLLRRGGKAGEMQPSPAGRRAAVGEPDIG